MGTSGQIIELAKKSGIPFTVGSTYRPGAVTKSGNRSFHADDNAVDFMGYNQDKLATYFLGLNMAEVFHFSDATGTWYGGDDGQPVSQSTHAQLVADHHNHLHVAARPNQVADVKKTNLLGMLSPAAGLLGGLPGPFDAAATLVDVVRPLGIVASNIADPMFWRRVGTGVIGVGLIVAGVVYLNRDRIRAAGAAVTGAVTNIAGTAVQGAAFGAGAGATGAIGAAKAAPKTAVPAPRPPRRALPSNAPVTSVLPEAYAPVSPGGTYEVTTAVGRAKRPAAPLPKNNTAKPRPQKKDDPVAPLFTPSATTAAANKLKGKKL